MVEGVMGLKCWIARLDPVTEIDLGKFYEELLTPEPLD
jgi:hypothetical protein